MLLHLPLLFMSMIMMLPREGQSCKGWIAAASNGAVDGWNNWQSWSSCTKSCGGGTRERRRDCANRSKVIICKGGMKWERGTCGNDPCPGESFQMFSSNLSQTRQIRQHGRVGEVGVRAQSLVVGERGSEQESANLVQAGLVIT